MKIHLTAALAFVVIRGALATTIIAAVPSKRIILGADSLVTYDDEKSQHELICKIESERGIAIASTGLAFIQDDRLSKRTFETAELSRRAIHGAKDVIDAADRFALLLRESMLKILSIEKVESPETYRLHVGPRGITTMVAGFHDGRPIVVLQAFSFGSSEIVENRRFLTAKLHNNFMADGEFLAIDRALLIPGWPTSDPIELVKKSLNLEIATVPHFVGGPLSII